MIINNLRFDSYRGLRNINISLNSKFTVIIGANGTGKSSVLDGISICLSWIIARIKSTKIKGKYIPADEVYNGVHTGTISASFDVIEKLEIPNITKSGISKSQSIDLGDLNNYTLAIRESIEQTNYRTNIPTFVHYGVKRAVINIPLRIKKPHIFDLLEAYQDSLDGDASFRTFFEWFRNQEDIENEHFARQDQTHSDQTAFSPDRELNTVRNAISIFLNGYENIRVQRRPLQMVITKNGQTLRIDQLSDGEKIYIAMIGDLCRRLVLANPTLVNPLEGEGIVLIDELDLHLHPIWQSEIATRLMEVFPNIQFIVSTHSPHVLNHINSEYIRILQVGESGDIVVNETEFVYGLKSDLILQEIMGLSGIRPKEIEERFDQFYSLLENDDVEQMKVILQHLEKEVPFEPELTRIRKLMERKVRLQK